MLVIPASIYGLHRLGMHLERRGLIHYWKSGPSTGGGYNPLQEIVQPQARHVVQVEEQRLVSQRDEGPAELPFKPNKMWFFRLKRAPP